MLYTFRFRVGRLQDGHLEARDDAEADRIARRYCAIHGATFVFVERWILCDASILADDGTRPREPAGEAAPPLARDRPVNEAPARPAPLADVRGVKGRVGA
jgi:hypothetical protein